MKKKLVLLCVLGLLCVTAAGCSKKEEPKKEAEPEVKTEKVAEPKEEKEIVEKKEPETILGTKTEKTLEVKLVNKAGQDIKAIWVKPASSEKWSEDYLKGKEPFAVDKEATLYYEPDVSDDATQVNVDICVTYADDATEYLHTINLGDLEKMELCREDNISFAKYTSILTKQEINMKETELALIEQKKAEEAAAKAEEAAAAQAAQEQEQSNSWAGETDNSNDYTEDSNDYADSSDGNVSQGEDNCAGGTGNYIINEDGSWSYVE